MNCPRCKQPMTLVLHHTRTGADGRENRKQYRCKACWIHETVTTKRKDDQGFRGEANL